MVGIHHSLRQGTVVGRPPGRLKDVMSVACGIGEGGSLSAVLGLSSNDVKKGRGETSKRKCWPVKLVTLPFKGAYIGGEGKRIQTRGGRADVQGLLQLIAIASLFVRV